MPLPMRPFAESLPGEGSGSGQGQGQSRELTAHARSEAACKAPVVEHLAREEIVDAKLVKVERPPRLLARLRDCVSADLRPHRTLDTL
eukprot:scaffold7017_cov75-Phaeocystis_antarctica.AAC.9